MSVWRSASWLAGQPRPCVTAVCSRAFGKLYTLFIFQVTKLPYCQAAGNTLINTKGRSKLHISRTSLSATACYKNKNSIQISYRSLCSQSALEILREETELTLNWHWMYVKWRWMSNVIKIQTNQQREGIILHRWCFLMYNLRHWRCNILISFLSLL